MQSSDTKAFDSAPDMSDGKGSPSVSSLPKQDDSSAPSARELKMRAVKDSALYKVVAAVSKYMDGYYLDGILGLIFPGVGDLLTQIAALPALLVAMFHVKSIPLSLAVLYNMMKDFAIGLLPAFVGDVLDFVHRSNTRNFTLIRGFVENDEDVVSEVNASAVKSAVLIVVMGFVAYCLFVFVWSAVTGAVDWVADLLRGYLPSAAISVE